MKNFLIIEDFCKFKSGMRNLWQIFILGKVSVHPDFG